MRWEDQNLDAGAEVYVVNLDMDFQYDSMLQMYNIYGSGHGIDVSLFLNYPKNTVR